MSQNSDVYKVRYLEYGTNVDDGFGGVLRTSYLALCNSDEYVEEFVSKHVRIGNRYEILDLRPINEEFSVNREMPLQLYLSKEEMKDWFEIEYGQDNSESNIINILDYNTKDNLSDENIDSTNSNLEILVLEE